ncbi:MAG: hypothetical protein ACK4MQ_07655 [Hyphomonas sp.]
MTARWFNNPEADDAQTKDKNADGYHWPEYLLNVDDLVRVSAEIDGCLKALVALDWPDMYDPSTKKDQYPNYNSELLDLARAGMRLKEVLLTGNREDDRSGRVARAFADWFAENVSPSKPGDWRIEVLYLDYPTSDPRTVPWGLIFEADPEKPLKKLDPTDPVEFGGFWGQRFGLSARGPAERIDRIKQKRDKALRMLVVFEQPDGGQGKLEQSALASARPSEAELDIATAEQHIAEDPNSYSDLVYEAVEQTERDTYLYMSLRSDVRPNTRNAISVPDIKELRGNEKKDVLMLVVLDGDAVIRGDRGLGWLENLMWLGENGLIATEVDVHNKQLRFLGWRVLTHILGSRKPILEAVREFREQVWPLGLIFGIYCNPIHVYVDPPPKTLINSISAFLKERRNAQT